MEAATTIAPAPSQVPQHMQALAQANRELGDLTVLENMVVPSATGGLGVGSTQPATSHGPSIAGMSVVKFRDRPASKFGSRSGCVPSTPVSMIPTSTPAPVAVSWAPSGVAPIISMLH